MKGIREVGVSYGKDLFELERSDKRQAMVQALKPGKVYNLYSAPQSHLDERSRAVQRCRRLVSHHNNYARFAKETQNFTSYVCYTYGELAILLKEPENMKIVKEGAEDE